MNPPARVGVNLVSLRFTLRLSLSLRLRLQVSVSVDVYPHDSPMFREATKADLEVVRAHLARVAVGGGPRKRKSGDSESVESPLGSQLRLASEEGDKLYLSRSHRASVGGASAAAATPCIASASGSKDEVPAGAGAGAT